MFECNYCKAVFVLVKISFLKNLCSGSQCGGFQFLLILDLWGISFLAAVVYGLGKDFLFKSALGHCECVPLRWEKWTISPQKLHQDVFTIYGTNILLSFQLPKCKFFYKITDFDIFRHYIFKKEPSTLTWLEKYLHKNLVFGKMWGFLVHFIRIGAIWLFRLFVKRSLNKSSSLQYVEKKQVLSTVCW